jgi:hypothetical protein
LFLSTSGSSYTGIETSITCSTSNNDYYTLKGSGSGNWECEDFLKISSSGVGINTSPSSFYDLLVYGNVGIGYSPSSSYELSVDGDANIEDHLAVGTSTSSSYTVDIDGDVRIKEGLGIGTSPPYSGLQIGSSSNFYVKTSLSSGSGTNLVISSGEVKKLSSSIRYKENVEDLRFDKDKFFSLRPVSFNYKKSVGGDGTSDIGLVAEEVEKYMPELVVYEPAKLLDDQGNLHFSETESLPEGIKYDRISLYLYDIVKKQDKEIQNLMQALDDQQKIISDLYKLVKKSQ